MIKVIHKSRSGGPKNGCRYHGMRREGRNTPWCTRCTFKSKDDYERLAEWLVEQMHMYAMQVNTEPHQIGEGYNNIVRMAAHELRTVGRKGIRAALTSKGKARND
jgi:hypothetical protein